MIKTVLSSALAGLFLVTLSGCSKDVKPEDEKRDFECKQEGVLAPKWTCIAEVADNYAGVGIAQKSAAGMAHMRRVALANGRSDLAGQIKSQIQDKITIYSGTTGVGSGETVDQSVEAVTKQLAKVDLADSKAIDTWTSPSGALYLLVAVSKKSANVQIQDNIKTSYQNDRALWQQFKAKNALESMEKDFASE